MFTSNRCETSASVPCRSLSLSTCIGEISLPASLASVGPGAFASCAGLTRVLFEQPEGWAVAEDEQSEPVPVSGTDLASGLIAAEMLTNTRCRCFWSKPDAAPGDPGEEGADG